MPKFYITTAIDYINSSPHLGTAYEKIGADIIARYKRIQGYDTFFLMGTDEHSLNVERQAKAEGVSTISYCGRMAGRFKDVWKVMDISFDDFIRTTEKRHIDAVQEFLIRIYKKGDVYRSRYKGWYCVSCERFFPGKDLTADGMCPVHNKAPQWIEEDNYFFALSKYQRPVLNFLKKNPGFIRPETRFNEIINTVEKGLEDISITRSSIGWGIPVPFDRAHVVYVWFDALINYISALGYPCEKNMFARYWPCDLHVIGKDITRFHCIIWPAMLMSAGIPLPHMVWGHGFVYMGREKMSKTAGGAVLPLDIAREYGADPIRYFLMREVPFNRDGEFTYDKFCSRYESDLANDLGNLIHRVLSMINRYNGGIIRRANTVKNSTDISLIDTAAAVVPEYTLYMDRYHLSQALESVWKLVSRANRYVEETSPWALNKNKQKDRLNAVLYNLAESVRIIGLLIHPFMPGTKERIYTQLGAPPETSKNWGALQDGWRVGAPEALFPKK